MSYIKAFFVWLAHLIQPFAPADGPPPQSLRPFVRWCLAGAWPVIAVALLASAAAGIMEVSSAWLLGVVVDRTVTATPQGFVAENWPLLVGYVLFYLALRPVFVSLSAAFNGIVLPPNLGPLIQSRLHRWSLGHAVTFFDNDFAGRIAQKQTQTANALVNVVNEVISAVAYALATLLGTVILLSTIDARIALLLMVWIALYAVMIAWYLPRIRVRAKARAGARAMVTGTVVDTITNIKTVKLFGHTDHEDQAATAAMADYREKALSFGYLSTGFRFALMATAGLLPVILVLATVFLWQLGQATPGEIAAVGAVAMRIAQMTGWVSFNLMGIYSNVGEVEDGMRTLTPPHALTDAPDADTMPRVTGQIVFDRVSFAYGRQSGGLQDLSLEIKPGEKIALVGASGVGKSTLVSLLLRLYDREAGSITVDGADIRQVTQTSLRRQIGTVTQETAMFNRSAMDNIRYGRPEATEVEVMEAARQAEAHAFITGLEDHRGRTGYDAHLGERGVKLSGGQRQRIALARAILKDAPILVLDEATSALDSEVEAAIQDTLAHVMDGKTVIAIAHRLSTIAAMDRIVVLEDGQIAEEGSHEALLAARGLYARFWARQSGGFIGVNAAAE